jgi:hypothetical protein
MIVRNVLRKNTAIFFIGSAIRIVLPAEKADTMVVWPIAS